MNLPSFITKLISRRVLIFASATAHIAMMAAANHIAITQRTRLMHNGSAAFVVI
jgi:hypothetical protein